MGDPTLNQDEIDALLSDMGGDDMPAAAADAPAMDVGGSDDLDGLGDLGDMGDFGSDMGDMGDADSFGDDLAGMLDEAPAAAAPAPKQAAAPQAAAPANVAQHLSSEYSNKNIEVLLDVPLDVVVELGRSEMPIQNILELGPGSIVELNRLSGEPINIMVNGKLVAKGEVVVVDENFGVKITSIISPMERLTQLN